MSEASALSGSEDKSNASKDLPRTLTTNAIDSNSRLIERQLQLGKPLKNSDLEDAVTLLPLSRVCTLKLVLKQREFPCTTLNTACQKAMHLEKIDFVALLLKHGATPSPSKLVHEMIRFCEHPTIQQYLNGWTTTEWATSNPKLDSEEWYYDYTKEKVCIAFKVYSQTLNFIKHE